MRENPKGARQQNGARPKPLTIVVQPGQVVIITAADASGGVPRATLDQLEALASSFPDSSSSPSLSRDSSSSPSLSKDRSGRP